jgi:signal transduction histidine kinase
MLMHELKTPLSIVSLALGTRNNREENLAHAGRAIQDMKAIIDRCVQADQLGQLKLTQQLENVNTLQLIRSESLATPLLAQRLRLQVPDKLPELQTDKQLLLIILNNLLDNAARYSDPLTDVTVRLQEQQHHNQRGLKFCVSNTPGIAGWPDENGLFSKYYRSVGAQRESGSGLGLFLSRQLAENLGGTLAYTPSAQLVEFSLWLPLSPC